MSEVSSQPVPVTSSIASEFSGALKWCRENPIAVVLAGTILGTLAFFFGVPHFYQYHSESVARWAWLAWNPEQNQEHSKLVPLIALYLVWVHREEILKAPKQGDWKGLIFVTGGILLFLLSVRCIEARMALMAVPFLLWGSILFLWGNKVARILFFPCAFLIFLIPFGAVEQATFKLQFIITGIVSAISNLVGIHIVPDMGTTLIAQDNSFRFEVIGDCSGIRSLTALTMLSTVYSHLTQKELWKKIVIIACSAFFAIIGNVGRILTILFVAKLFNKDIAGGAYHTYSGWIIFPFAIAAMLGVDKLVNLDYSRFMASSPSSTSENKPAGKDGGSYDY